MANQSPLGVHGASQIPCTLTPFLEVSLSLQLCLIPSITQLGTCNSLPSLSLSLHLSSLASQEGYSVRCLAEEIQSLILQVHIHNAPHTPLSIIVRMSDWG